MVRGLIVLGLVLLAVVVWRCGTTVGMPGPVAGQPVGAAAGVEAAGAGAGVGGGPVEAGGASAERRDAAAPTGGDDAPTFVVVGRCVQASSGQPLAGCEPALRLDAADDAPALASAITPVDGRFVLQCTHDPWVDSLRVTVTRDGYVARSGVWPTPEAGTTVDLGDLPMLEAIEVRGVVVDTVGAPVEGVDVLFAHIELQSDRRSDVEPEDLLRATSDTAGRFVFAGRAFPGEWYCGAEYSGALVEPRSVRVEEGTSPFHLRVVVERPDPAFDIVGSVVDEAGQPVGGMRFAAYGEGFMGRGRSQRDGRVVIRRAGPIRDDGEPGAYLNVDDPSGRYEVVEPAADARFAWGSRDELRVVVRDRVDREVHVRRRDGDPVTRYTLFVLRGEQRLQLAGSLTQRGVHEDGRCRLPRLRSGAHAVLAVPRDRQLAPSLPVRFEQVPGVVAAPVAVVLDPPAQVVVVVRDQAGEPLADSDVELVMPLGDATLDAAAVVPALERLDHARSPSHVAYARSVTDANGAAALEAPAGDYLVRVRGADHVAAIEPLRVRDGAGPQVVRVRRAASLFGVVGPADALQRLRELASQGGGDVRVAVGREREHAPEPAVVAADGSFAIGGLDAGAWSVSLRYWLRTGEVRADDVTLWLGDVTLAEGERRELPIDASAILPGTVRGTIRAGREPLANVHCFLRRNGPGPFLNLRVATDANGAFAGVVPAGDYGFSMTYPAQPGPGWLNIVLPDEWQLQPGQVHDVQFDVPLRRVRLRVVGPDGAPVAGAQLKVTRTGYFLPGGLETSADGTCEVFPAPLDRFDVQVRVGDAEPVELGPVDLPAGQLEGTVELRLPDR